MILNNGFFSGGLFDLSESKQEVAFRYAVERVNANRNILPKSLLSAQIEKIPPQDSFHASKRGKRFKMALHFPRIGQFKGNYFCIRVASVCFHYFSSCHD
jgi:hypothetical protein